MLSIAKERRRIPPGPSGLPILGNVLEFVSGHPLQLFLNSAREFGDIVQFRVGPLPAYLLNHPDHVRHVLQENAKAYKKSFNYEALRLMLGQGLLTSEGELWLRQRRLIQPAFSRQRLNALVPIMVAATAAMLTRWESHARSGIPIDLDDEMMRLGMSITSRALFGIDISDDQALSAVLNDGRLFVEERTLSLLRLPLWIPTPKNRRARQILEVLERTFLRIIAERRRDPAPHDDLLAMLLSARDEQTQTGMSDRQLRDEVLTLLVTSHETTANALTWSFYLLSQHAESAHRLTAESCAVLGAREPEVADLASLLYTQQVLLESMRLYPPVWVLERQPIMSDEIDGYDVHPGMLVLVCPYTLHRHPRYWEDPDRFDPDRFSRERSEGRPRFVYLPFSVGPRQCIGNHYAVMTAQIVLAMVARRYALRLVPGQAVEPASMVTLRPRQGIKMTLDARAG